MDMANITLLFLRVAIDALDLEAIGIGHPIDEVMGHVAVLTDPNDGRQDYFDNTDVRWMA